MAFFYAVHAFFLSFLKKKSFPVSALAILGFMFFALALIFSIPSPLLRDKLTLPQRLSMYGGSVTERQIIWKTTALMIRESGWLGVGTGQFKLNYLQTYTHLNENVKKLAYEQDFPKQSPTEAHNEYLQILSELGILGLFAFLWLIVYIFLCGMQCLNAENSTRTILFYAASLSSFISLCITSFFGFPFHLPQTLALFSLSSAILTRRTPAESKENVYNKKLHLTELKRTLVCLILAPFLILSSLNTYRSSVALRKGRTALSSRDVHAAKKYFDAALALSPYDGEVLFYKGVLLYSMRKYDGAYTMFKKAEETTSNLNLNMAIAKTAMLSGKLTDSEKDYKYILSFYPWKEYQCVSYTDLADIYTTLKQNSKAIESLQQSLLFCENKNLKEEINAKIKKLLVNSFTR